MAQEARVLHLENQLKELGYLKSLHALFWMIQEMNAEKGYKRHDGSHYYYHLVDSAQDLLNHGIRDEEIITATILHDAIEDIHNVTYDLIKNYFGERVAYLVDGVTKKEGINYKEVKNLIAYLDYITQDPAMCLIKTADRKHNFSTLNNSNTKHEINQAIQTELYFLPFFKEARKRYPQYSAYFHSAKTSIMPHLIKIKRYHEDIRKYKERIKNLEEKLAQKGIN